MKVTGRELASLTGMPQHIASGLLKWLHERGAAELTLRETFASNGKRIRPNKVYEIDDPIVVSLRYEEPNDESG
jgi:hypothetical protein